MQFVVMPPVLKLLFNLTAHFEVTVGRHRHVACIEKTVDVAPKQKPIPGLMCAAVAVWPDMRGFKRRKGPLLRNRATAIVGVGDEHTERALPKAWTDQMRFAKPSLWFDHTRGLRAVQAIVHRIP